MTRNGSRGRQTVNASSLEIDEFLKRHGIDPVNLPTICQLIQEANELTQGKRRNIYERPIYRWEVRYGIWAYQIGPVSCVTALTKEQSHRLFQITCQLDKLLNNFEYDPENMTVTIPCTLNGTCRYCSSL